MSPVSTHVLDTTRGCPAAGVPVRLERLTGAEPPELIGHALSDEDGRVRALGPLSAPLQAGAYRLTFDTSRYFDGLRCEAFYPEVVVTFVIRDPGASHHVPLLLSAYGYSTYKGS